jgi:hypothetical protein
METPSAFRVKKYIAWTASKHMLELEYRDISNLSGRPKSFDDSALLKSKNCHIQQASTNMFPLNCHVTYVYCPIYRLNYDYEDWLLKLLGWGINYRFMLINYKLYEAAESKTVFMENALIDKVQEWYAKVAQQTEQSLSSSCGVELRISLCAG